MMAVWERPPDIHKFLMAGLAAKAFAACGGLVAVELAKRRWNHVTCTKCRLKAPLHWRQTWGIA